MRCGKRGIPEEVFTGQWQYPETTQSYLLGGDLS